MIPTNPMIQKIHILTCHSCIVVTKIQGITNKNLTEPQEKKWLLVLRITGKIVWVWRDKDAGGHIWM